MKRILSVSLGLGCCLFASVAVTERASARECVMYVGAHPDEFINEVGVACLLSNWYDNIVVTLTHGERGRPDWTMEKTKKRTVFMAAMQATDQRER